MKHINLVIKAEELKAKLNIQDGKTPTQEELLLLINPLIPTVQDGKDGNDYVLTEGDKKEIARLITVPVVEKVIEKTEVIHEQPIYNTEVKEVYKEPNEEELEKLAKQINSKIDYKIIQNAPKWPSGGLARVNEERVREIIAETPSANAFTDLTDTPSSYTGQALKATRVNASATGIEFYTTTDTDEKVKLNASDPTAGYLDDKIATYRFSLDFVTGDWVINGVNYELEVEHNLDASNPKVSILMAGSQVSPNSVSVIDNNTVLLSVPGTPDLRFAGSVSVSSI